MSRARKTKNIEIEWLGDETWKRHVYISSEMCIRSERMCIMIHAWIVLITMKIVEM